MRFLLVFALVAVPAFAEEPVRTASDLAADGFVPFAVTSQAGSAFGMRREGEMYLCVIGGMRAAAGALVSAAIPWLPGPETIAAIPTACGPLE